MIVLSIFFCLCLSVCCHFLFGNFFAISMNTRSKFCSKAEHATIFTVGFQYFISRFLLPESLKTKTYAFDVKNLFYSLKPNYSFETSLLHKNPLFYNNRNMGSFRFISFLRLFMQIVKSLFSRCSLSKLWIVHFPFPKGKSD
jgi:hypothetical protein